VRGEGFAEAYRAYSMLDVVHASCLTFIFPYCRVLVHHGEIHHA